MTKDEQAYQSPLEDVRRETEVQDLNKMAIMSAHLLKYQIDSALLLPIIRRVLDNWRTHPPGDMFAGITLEIGDYVDNLTGKLRLALVREGDKTSATIYDTMDDHAWQKFGTAMLATP